MNSKMLYVCILFAVTLVFSLLPGESKATPLVPNNNTDLSLFRFPGHGHGVSSGYTSQRNGVPGGFPGHGNGVTDAFPGLGNGLPNGPSVHGNGVGSAGAHAPEPMSLVLLASGLVGLIGIKRTKRMSSYLN